MASSFLQNKASERRNELESRYGESRRETPSSATGGSASSFLREKAAGRDSALRDLTGTEKTQSAQVTREVSAGNGYAPVADLNRATNGSGLSATPTASRQASGRSNETIRQELARANSELLAARRNGRGGTNRPIDGELKYTAAQNRLREAKNRVNALEQELAGSEAVQGARRQLDDVTQRLKDTRSAMGKVAGRSGYAEHREFERLTKEAQELESARRQLVSELKNNGGKLTAAETMEDIKSGAADFLDSVLSGGDQAWGGIYGLLSMADEVTGRGESPFRETAEHHNTKAAETLQRATEGRGSVARQVMQTGQAVGNMLSSASLTGLAAGSGAGMGATFTGGAAGLGSTASQAAASRIASAGARLGNELLANATNAAVSLGSAGHSYLSATEGGADPRRAMANAVGSGLLEYMSNKLFSGTPLEDSGDKGYVTKLVEYMADRLGKSDALGRFLSSAPGQGLNIAFDKLGEGLEEVVTAIGDPLIERITWNPDADLATASEIADAFVGGVALSLMMSGGEAIIDNAARAGSGFLSAAGNAARQGIGPEASEAAPDAGEAQPEDARTGDFTPDANRGAEAQISPQSAEANEGPSSESHASPPSAAVTETEAVSMGDFTSDANRSAEAQISGSNAAANTAAAMDELGAHPSEAPTGLASDSLSAYGTMNAARQAEFRRAERVAERFGAVLDVAELEDGVDGRYQNGRITISPNAKNPVRTVLVHELTHHMESSSRYADFADAILDYVSNEMGADVDTMKRAIRQEYTRSGFSLDDEGAEREIVAKFAESKLFTDEAAIERLARKNRSIFETVRRWLSDMVVRLTGTDEAKFLRKAERMYERALESVGNAAADSGRAAKYSIEVIDGQLMPVVDTQNDTRSPKAAEAYLKTLVDSKNPFTTILADAQPVYLGKDLPDEYKGSEDTWNLNSTLRAAKMQAATNLDEMLLLAENGEWREDANGKHGAKAADGWYRYDTQFAMPILNMQDGKTDHYNIYSGTLIIRNDADGKSYLYDLIGLKKEKETYASPSSRSDVSGLADDRSFEARFPSQNNDSTDPANVNGNIGNEYDEYDRYRLRTAEEQEPQNSFGSGFDELAEGARYLPEELGAEAAESSAQDGRRNRPSRSKAHLRHELTSIFSVPAGSRATFNERINAVAEEMLREGRISDENRAEMIRVLYAAGVSLQDADPSYQAARSFLRGRRVYVNESIRADLGDEWNSLRARAMGNGFYLVTDQGKGTGVDAIAEDLANAAGHNVIDVEADGATQLRQMVDAAERGKGETISLADEAEQMVGQYGEEVREAQISNLERQFDDAIRRFAEKARLEVELKDYSDARVERRYQRDKDYWQNRLKAERDAKWERVEKEKNLWRNLFKKNDEARKQREAAAQTLRNLKRLRRRIGQNDTRLAAAMERLSPEEQTIANEALGNIATDAQRLTDVAKRKMQENAERYEQLLKEDPNYIPDKKTLALLERMDKTYLADLTSSELMDVHRALQALEQHLTDMNKEIGKERNEEYSSLYKAVRDEVGESKGRGKTAGALNRFFNEEQLTPMNYIEMLGGWKRNNNWTEAVARQLERGERAKKQFIVEANDMVKDFREKNADWIARSDGQGKDAVWYDIEVPALLEYDEGHKPIFSSETVTVHLTPAMKVELARGIRNADNLRHAEGGITFPDKELYAKGERKEAYNRGTTIKLAPETMKSLFAYDTLTDEEKALFALMDRFFDGKAKQAINETSQQLDGIDRALTKHYSKIYTNKNYRSTDVTKIDESIGGMGSLQKRVFSKNPMLAMSVWEAFDDTVDTVAKYHGLAIPTRNVNMLLNWTEPGGGNSMKNILSQTWGGDAVSYLENLLRDLQNPKIREKSFVDLLAGKALNNYVTATFGMNPGIVLKQFSSFPSAMAVLGADTVPTPAQIARTDADLIRRYTPELEYRSMGYATPELAELKNNPNWTQRNKVTRFLFGGAIQGMDRFTVKAMWPWAENYVRKNHAELKPGSDAFYRKTAEIYNDALSQTQPMYDVMHRAKIMQNANDLTRAFTMFKTVPLQQQNMLRKAVGEARSAKGTSGQKKANQNLARTVGSIVFANLLFEAIEFGNQAWKNAAKNYRDDDDELTALSAGGEMVKSSLKDMTGMFIGGDELGDLVEGVTGSSRYYDMESPGLTQISDVFDATVTAGKSIRKLCEDMTALGRGGGSIRQYVRDNGGDLLGGIKNLAESMSVYFAGVPTPNIEKYLLGAIRAVSPKAEQAYKALFDTTTKRDLSGLSGEALQVRVSDLIDSRVHGVGRDAKRELARLYESTGVEVIPTDIPGSVTVDGEQHTLTAAEQQKYRNAYADALDSLLDRMLTGEDYKDLTDEQRAGAITSLYGYAKSLARSAATDTELPASAEKVRDAGEMGLDASKYFLIIAQLGEFDELEGDERGEARVNALRDMKLTGAEKSAAYYAIFASDREKALIDNTPGLSVGEAADTLLGLRSDAYLSGDAKTRALRQTILDASLPEREKRSIYRAMISDKHEEVIDELARSGISFDTWLTFERDTVGLRSSKDANGKDIKGQTRQDKVWRVIDGYRLSKSQKNAMHFAAGYKESSLKNAPWA